MARYLSYHVWLFIRLCVGSAVMYAVIESGGKQYRVKEGETLKLEKIEQDPGSTLEFDKILLVGEGEELKIGKPFVKGCKVTGSVEEHGRAKKIKIVKFKRRKHHIKTQGHRQSYTTVKITGIDASSASSVA